MSRELGFIKVYGCTILKIPKHFIDVIQYNRLCFKPYLYCIIQDNIIVLCLVQLW